MDGLSNAFNGSGGYSFTGGAAESTQTSAFTQNWSGGGDINIGSGKTDNTKLLIGCVVILGVLWLFSRK